MFFGSIDSEARDLISRLLVFNPNERLTAEEALSHPFMKEFHDPSEQISYKGVIEIPIDDNTKFSIKEYREALYKEITKKHKKADDFNVSVLSTQDSNNQKKKQYVSQKNQSSQNTRYEGKRNYTEYHKAEEMKQKQIKREPSYKRRDPSK